jgi:ATP/maltotriose-dependent transcriptional regulator MalT
MIRPVSADGRIERGGVFTPVVRPRVIERIGMAAAQRIVLIVAPAGYGKSLALNQYLESVSDEHVRFNVRPEHAKLLGFLRGFSEAMSDVAPDARKTLTAAYEANSASKTSGTDLAMWMHSHIKSYTGMIAVDDLHTTEADPEVTRFLSSLIDRTKGRTRWLLASRSTLDLPVGSWLAYGDMDLTVDEQDLRFTLDEARQAARAVRVAVRDEELSELLSMIDGWPTALSFALRSSTRSVDLRNITASTREMVYRYLAEQVYRGLTSDEQDLLHFVSYLDEIDLEVLRKAGYTRAKGIIENLRDRVAFIYPERPSIYRCHDLFRDFLQHQLELQGDATVVTVRLNVARSLEAANKIASALSIFAQAGSVPNVLRLLELHGFELSDQGHGDVVQQALDVITHDIRATNPIVLGIRGMTAADAGRLDRAESLLQRAIAEVNGEKLKAVLSIKLALILANQMKDIAGVLEPLRLTKLPNNLRGEIISLLAVSYAYAGRLSDAENAIDEADALVGDVENDQDRAKILHRLGIAMAQLGLPLERVLTVQKRAAALASEQGLFGLAGRAFSSLASIALFYEGDITKEIWYAQQASTASMKAGDRVNLQTALLQLMDIEGRRGNSERLQTLEKQLAAVATSDVNRLVYVVPVRAFAAAWQGKFDEAHRLMATVAGNARLFDFDRTLNAASDALFLLADKRREQALALTAQTLIEVENIKSRLPHARRQNEITKLICAAVEGLAGRQINAQRILQGKHPDYGPAVQAIRNAVVTVCRLGRGAHVTDDLLDHLAGMTATGYGGLARVLELAVERCLDGSADVSDELTQAQIRILEELAAGRTPKEIAQETGRSVYTVQTHIQNIIKRLGCSGRNEALMVARTRGLLA